MKQRADLEKEFVDKAKVIVSKQGIFPSNFVDRLISQHSKTQRAQSTMSTKHNESILSCPSPASQTGHLMQGSIITLPSSTARMRMRFRNHTHSVFTDREKFPKRSEGVSQ